MKKQLPIHRASPALSLLKGFTLIEMVTVLTIIIIVLAIAIPVWDALMNGTNIAAAQNQISAYIANARADAVYNRQTIGVAFYVDPKTQQTAMAEVQVQTLYQTHPYSGSVGYTPIFQPGTWAPGSPPTFTASTASNGPINSIELVNSPDPNNPGKFIFYRDVSLLPKGVAVALNNNTYTYNQDNNWGKNPNGLPPLDRYLRMGVIMFNPDGTLASVPFGVPLYEFFTQAQSTDSVLSLKPPENALCQKIGMYQSDIAGNVTAPAGSNPPFFPLISSVGFVVYDRDVYLNQHASMQVMNNATSPAAPINIGNNPPDPFTEGDLNYFLPPNSPLVPGVTPPANLQQNKFIEEDWIDKNGIAFLVSPNNGSLIKAK